MKRKAYMSPASSITKVNLHSVICTSPIHQISGLNGVEKGEGDFVGGAADSRRGNSLWDDDEE